MLTQILKEVLTITTNCKSIIVYYNANRTVKVFTHEET